MKKILAMMLTAAMMLSMGTAVWADGEETTKWNGTYTSSAPTSFTIDKTYESEETRIPKETLTFTVVADTTNPSTDPKYNLTVGTDNTWTIANDAKGNNDYLNVITVNVPAYDAAGTYKYTIKEIGGNGAGVTYDTEKEIKVVVYVGYDNVAHQYIIVNPDDPANEDEAIKYYILNTGNKENPVKVDEFENEFVTGDFSVAKDVTGNLANEKDEFDITVTLTSDKEVFTDITVGGSVVAATEWGDNAAETDDETTEIDETIPTEWTYTTTITISENGGAKTFDAIPAGVKVTVAEVMTEDKMNGYTFVSIAGGTVSDDKKSTSFIVTDENSIDVVVINNKDTEVDTGISVDSIPYIAMLGVVAIGGTGFIVSKKRRSED